MTRPIGCFTFLACLTAAAAGAVSLRTTDGLRLSAELPSAIGPVLVDRQTVSQGQGGLSLIDPRTGAVPPAGKFSLTAEARQEPDRIAVHGVVVAAGDQETVCQLQARIPVGDEGWLFWDDMTRSRAIRRGEGYVQSVYPICCVTDPAKRLGLAVSLDPDPLQPATLSYDPASKAMIVNWFLGFTPLARSEYRMRAPFKIELYRVLPGWAFRSALDRYYHLHPSNFDWRSKHEGLWLFASASESLPNPQHYAYDEGGPPPTSDLPRGIATFPYSCTGDSIIALPPDWGVPKNYEEMLDRLARWEQVPRLSSWDELSDYEIDKVVAHSGKRSLKLSAASPGVDKEVRQSLDLNQKKVDPITVSVWSRGQDVTGAKDPHYGLWVDMEMTDGEHQYGKVAPADVGDHEWQELKLVLGADKPISQMRVYLLFRRTHTGTAWFDDVSITAASDPTKNLAKSAGFEEAGPPAQLVMVRDNVMYDENDHMRYFADTWGGADVPPASPINWLRFVLLVNPDQKNPEGRPTASDVDLSRYDTIFAQWPDCRGAYLDGTSGWSTTGFDYRRDHFHCFNDPFQYVGSVHRPCASGMASVVRWVEAFKQRYGAAGKLAFGNVWASNRMFPVCMALDVCGYESSRWYDLDHADYYRAAAYHKPGLYLNYFRIGQQLDTREGGERFYRYATAYGLFPSIGRFTDEAYEKFGDLQHRYVPIVKHLFRAGWEPVTHAQGSDPTVRVQRFGTKPPIYFTLLNPGAVPREVKLTIDSGPLGLKGTSLAAVEVASSSPLPLSKAGSSLMTRVTLGPEDAAVVALLPASGVASWYRERAAESLQGAAYVYAQTPPTVETAALAQRVRAVRGESNAAKVATTIDAVKVELARLRGEGAKLPDDLKRRSYLRELVEAERLLNEALLADARGRVGWKDGLLAPIDGRARVAVEVSGQGRNVHVLQTRVWPGRSLEPPEHGGSLQDTAQSATILCPPERAVTAAADIEFRDAAGQATRLRRVGYAFFGPICELSAEALDNGSGILVHFRNSDTRAREFDLSLSAPHGVSLTPEAVKLKLGGGESKDITIRTTYAAGLKSGTYPVDVTARSDSGTIAEQTEVPMVYVLPLEAGDLALAATGASVSVDSFYFAYSERPVNDGIVNPVGQAFNAAAWASSEAVEDHWVEIQWPQPQTVGRVVVYWNVENGAVWTSRHFVVQVKDGDAWKTVGEATHTEAPPVTECKFPLVKTKALRILQPKGEGPATRPNLMWLREVAVYGG